MFWLGLLIGGMVITIYKILSDSDLERVTSSLFRAGFRPNDSKMPNTFQLCEYVAHKRLTIYFADKLWIELFFHGGDLETIIIPDALSWRKGVNKAG